MPVFHDTVTTCGGDVFLSDKNFIEAKHLLFLLVLVLPDLFEEYAAAFLIANLVIIIHGLQQLGYILFSLLVVDPVRAQSSHVCTTGCVDSKDWYSTIPYHRTCR